MDAIEILFILEAPIVFWYRIKDKYSNSSFDSNKKVNFNQLFVDLNFILFYICFLCYADFSMPLAVAMFLSWDGINTIYRDGSIDMQQNP